MNTPVVFIVFNRPEPTRRVLERIRQARPPQLLVVCDGPRAHVPTDAARVAEVREIIAQSIDWPCELRTDFAETNLGCRERVTSGLNWAFSLVEEAVILEDDCLADPSFFTFCDAMLARYRNDEKVMHVNGTNFLASRWRPSTSYYFSKYVWVWGWATWRRAWQQYDPTMASWNERLPALENRFDSGSERAFWLSTFNHARADWTAANTWDFQWIYTCWSLGGFTIVPSVNLVENLGFGLDATHTTDTSADHLHLTASPLQITTHPRTVSRSRLRDHQMFCAYAGEPRADLKDSLRVVRQTLSRMLARARH